MRRLLVPYTVIVALLFGAFSAFQQHQAQAGFPTLMGVGVPPVSGGGSCNPPLLSCVTVPSGLTFWMPLDTSTTSGSTTNDLSGNGNNGTLVASPSLVTGQIQQAVSLNGSSQYVTIPSNASMPSNGSFSITAWVNPASTADGEVMDNDVGGGECIELRQSRSGSGFFNFIINPGSPTVIASTITVASRVGLWTFLAATYDGTTITLYVNGSSQASASSSASSCGQQPFTIGNDPANSGPFYAGKIDDVRTYSSALSPTDITSIYNSGLAGKP